MEQTMEAGLIYIGVYLGIAVLNPKPKTLNYFTLEGLGVCCRRV